jgi:hypothetical protein
MRHYLLAAALMLAAPLAFAAKPSDAQIDRLLEVSRTRQTLVDSLAQVEVVQEKMMREKFDGKLDAAMQARLERLLEIQRRNLREALSWERMGPLYRDVYRGTFEAEDIDGLIEFYASPTGQRFIERTPKLAEQLMVALDKVLTPMMQQLEADLEKEMRSLEDPIPVDIAPSPARG